MIAIYYKTKENIIQLKDWVMKHPKESYKYVMILLLISFAFSFIQYFFFKPKVAKSLIFPEMYSKSDKTKSDIDQKDQKAETIIKELESYKTKRESGEPLTKNDSLRIEYLFNQYQNLKNGN
ncbi:hypothetical protein [Kaistella yonginensis]|uniref:hypothetical protein n=1 Tax=Kaistella yonginensis TaxID=658267 RepID=UPI0025B4EB6D|nr:hypothetical protein [Kaistella yonginensis]MDN3607233.1 hypothetical protein [Kaistella yonginensis]